MNLPVANDAFWRERILQTLATGREIHTVIYDIDGDTWNDIQNLTAGILQRYVKEGNTYLDAGWGYGAAFDACQQFRVLRNSRYVGIDISSDLIEMGKIRHPALDLHVANLLVIPFPDKTFDVSFCRSIKDMLLDNGLDATWERIESELKRVSRITIVMDYENIENYEVLA